VIASLAFGLAGTLLLRKIISPLGKVIDQAESIGQQQFVISEEPATKEFKLLVQAMNKLSNKVKELLAQKTVELETLKQRTYQDELTQLANRDHFNNMFESYLGREDIQARGTLLLLRVARLAEVNQRFNHNTGNEILKAVSGVLSEVSNKHNDDFAGRLNGTDFALVSFRHEETATETANKLAAEINKALEKYIEDGVPIDVPLVACYIEDNDDRSKVFSLLDGTLAGAEDKGSSTVIALENNPPKVGRNANDWREALTESLAHNKILLGNFPVKSFDDEIIHSEMPVRLDLHGGLQTAGYFIGWSIKLDLLKDIDLAVLKLACITAREQDRKIAINLSEGTLLNAHTRHTMEGILSEYQDVAPLIWIEFQESAAVRHPEQLFYFCQSLKKLGCKVGLEHVGFEFSKIENLTEMGLNYLKIDNAFIKNVHLEEKHHAYLRGLCSIGRQLGITMIAEGVSSKEEFQALEALHLDGATGPGVE
jgi:diguanylate cyclase (GGDEF)-like protein